MLTIDKLVSSAFLFLNLCVHELNLCFQFFTGVHQNLFHGILDTELVAGTVGDHNSIEIIFIVATAQCSIRGVG